MTRMQRRIAKIRAIKKTAKQLLASSKGNYTKLNILKNNLIHKVTYLTYNKKKKVRNPAIAVRLFLKNEIYNLEWMRRE